MLIFSAGLVGPLAYVDVYSPHRVAHTFHLTVLQDGTANSRLAYILKSIRQEQKPPAAAWQMSQFPVMERHFLFPELVKNLQLVVENYCLTRYSLDIHAQQPCLVYRLRDFSPLFKSAQVPPPDKPPPTL